MGAWCNYFLYFAPVVFVAGSLQFDAERFRQVGKAEIAHSAYSIGKETGSGSALPCDGAHGSLYVKLYSLYFSELADGELNGTYRNFGRSAVLAAAVVNECLNLADIFLVDDLVADELVGIVG